MRRLKLVSAGGTALQSKPCARCVRAQTSFACTLRMHICLCTAMSSNPEKTRASSIGSAPSEHTADLVRVAVLVTKAERQRLKVAAAQRGTTISEVVREGIARFLDATQR